MLFTKADVPFVSEDTYYLLSDHKVDFVDKKNIFNNDLLTKNVLVYKKGTFIQLPCHAFYTALMCYIRYSSSAFP